MILFTKKVTIGAVFVYKKMPIKDVILKLAKSKQAFKSSHVLEALDNKFSRQYVIRVLKQMVNEGKLIREGGGRSVFYALPEKSINLKKQFAKRFHNKGLKEHEIWFDVKSKSSLLLNINENLDSILAYAFQEMLNNAIEHSKSKSINISVNRDSKNFSFEVKDFGIGVFKNIMQKRKLKSLLEAIQDLLKGKTTTAPKAHSGEGIFFTSKIADKFVLDSYGLSLVIDNLIGDIFIHENKNVVKGTSVSFEIAINSKKRLSDIFKQFQTNPDDYAFDKTEVLIKLYTMGTIYISRSQARRVLTGLDKFKTVVLDFDKVPTVGQAFADEIFRVFKIKHPDIEVIPVNMVEPVEFMIKRVAKV